MTFLLGLRDRLSQIFNKYNTYIVPAAKFLTAVWGFLMLNATVGYTSAISNPLIAILLAAVCAFTPSAVTLLVLTVFMMIHLFGISPEFAIIVLCIVVVMYLFYFRFTPKMAYILLAAIFVCTIHIPYLLPVSVALVFGMSSAIPVGCGVIIYYVLQTASAYQAAISKQVQTESLSKITYILDIVNDKEMLVIAVVFMVTIVVTYLIRKIPTVNSWLYAIVAGTGIEFLMFLVCQLVFSIKINLIVMIIGVILGAVIGYLCKVVFFSVDFNRTEVVEFEDDEYYYYVKAVPKLSIAKEEVTVKQINARKIKDADVIADVAGEEEQPEIETSDTDKAD